MQFLAQGPSSTAMFLYDVATLSRRGVSQGANVTALEAVGIKNYGATLNKAFLSLFNAGSNVDVKFKLGRAAYKPVAVKTLAEYVTLPQPPLVAHWGHAVAGQLGMDGNDEYGDCTIAGAAHALTVWNHEVDETIPVPDSAGCVTQYFTLEGSPNGEPNQSLDQGLAMTDVLKTWQTAGLFNGTKIAAFAPVTVSNQTEIKQAVAYYGACYLGVNLPESAQQQFPNPWTVVEGSPIEGGHCITATGYDSKYLYCATWGSIVSVAWDWVAEYLEEAYAIIPQAFIDAGKGPLTAADLSVLQQDLSAI